MHNTWPSNACAKSSGYSGELQGSDYGNLLLKHAFKSVARKPFNTSSSFCKKQRRSSNSDDSMALAYADHSVARTHASADQNVARTRCESTQLQGCIVYMRNVCWHRVSAIYDSYVACLLYMIVFSPNRCNHSTILMKIIFSTYIQHAATHMLANADRNVARRVSLANSMMHALKKTCDDSKHDIIWFKSCW